jgi:hypothetical protein
MMARHKAFEWKDFGEEVNEDLIHVILGYPGQFDCPPISPCSLRNLWNEDVG